jgi:hypothetical protein
MKTFLAHGFFATGGGLVVRAIQGANSVLLVVAVAFIALGTVFALMTERD